MQGEALLEVEKDLAYFSLKHSKIYFIQGLHIEISNFYSAVYASDFRCIIVYEDAVKFLSSSRFYVRG